jgi:hypothetical protein
MLEAALHLYLFIQLEHEQGCFCKLCLLHVPGLF